MHDLKQFHSALVEATKKYGFNSSVLLIHLVKAIYADEKLTNLRLAFLCGINEKTLYRNADDIRKIAEILPIYPTHISYPSGQPLPKCPTQIGGVVENERKGSPQTPFIKKEKEKSFPQTPNGGFPPDPQGGSAQESLHDVLNNIKQDFYKSHGIVTTADSYTSVGVDDTQVDNSPKRELTNPQEFQKFWDDYPKRKGMNGGGAYEKVRHLWMQLEESGWGYEINTALKAALCSKRWSENNGQFIPTVFNFLENEEFRQFLSAGYKPTKPQPKRDQKPLEGGIYDLL